MGYGAGGNADVSIDNTSFVVLANAQRPAAYQYEYNPQSPSAPDYTISLCVDMITYAYEHDEEFAKRYGGVYKNSKDYSLTINIVCQYLFWDRLDRLLNLKKAYRLNLIQ